MIHLISCATTARRTHPLPRPNLAHARTRSACDNRGNTKGRLICWADNGVALHKKNGALASPDCLKLASWAIGRLSVRLAACSLQCLCAPRRVPLRRRRRVSVARRLPHPCAPFERKCVATARPRLCALALNYVWTLPHSIRFALQHLRLRKTRRSAIKLSRKL